MASSRRVRQDVPVSFCEGVTDTYHRPIYFSKLSMQFGLGRTDYFFLKFVYHVATNLVYFEGTLLKKLSILLEVINNPSEGNQMNSIVFKRSLIAAGILLGSAGQVWVNEAQADIYVTDAMYGRVGDYTNSGAVVNASLISGLGAPTGIAVSGSNLFVVDGGTVGEYTTSGAVVNASLISEKGDRMKVAKCHVVKLS